MLFAPCAVAAVVVAIFVLSTTNSQQIEYNSSALSIIRNFNTPDEEHALTTAESVDYTTITGNKRFDTKDSEDYKHPGTYISYVYAKFIDTEVLKYYQERYDYQQKQTNPKGVTLSYIANVTKLAHVHISNEMRDIYSSSHMSIVFYDPDKSTALPTKFMSPTDTTVYYKNQSKYQVLPSELDLTFSNCYVVEMKCQYSEYYGPTAAWWADAYQIVILDQNLVPVLICIYDAPRIVA